MTADVLLSPESTRVAVRVSTLLVRVNPSLCRNCRNFPCGRRVDCVLPQCMSVFVYAFVRVAGVLAPV